MSSRTRTLFALPLTLCVLACHEGGPDETRLRSLSGDDDTTVRLGLDLEPVLVTSYSLSHATADALDAAGFDTVLEGSAGTVDEALVSLRFDGVALPPVKPGEEALAQLQRGEEVLDVPYSNFNFKVVIGNDGNAVTEILLQQADTDEAELELSLADDLGAAPTAPGAVEAVQYVMVAVDGTVTTCSAPAPRAEELTLGFTPIESDPARAHLAVNVDDTCAAVLEDAADRSPPDAFFVRCDETTMSTIVGVHKVTDVTLKRGVFKASGEPQLHVAGG